ncbi:hypothetical protein [Kitasatospora brasiliensis]|uniref:hypothetical protein n=1 Tax=Kitasatospora brasiliensis TaxID=3058040 RepID=UPI00292F0933|nr:hypothetical protein [Kitasatospora sp. K002]
MTDTPVRVGPSDTKDATLALLLFPLLAALPAIVFRLGSATAEAAGYDTGGTLMTAVLCAAVIGWCIPFTVFSRALRADYRALPIAAAVAPFVVPLLLALGAFR